MEWQPIATAPRDVPLLVFFTPTPIDASIGQQAVLLCNGRGEWIDEDDPDDMYNIPTHWMPLPEPPV